MAARGGWLPPQPPICAPDEACWFSIVRKPAKANVKIVLSNSFGFGGANASLIFRRWP
jgi:3-oxoacyl-[acyl-carrier-protein] synthase II